MIKTPAKAQYIMALLTSMLQKGTFIFRALKPTMPVAKFKLNSRNLNYAHILKPTIAVAKGVKAIWPLFTLLLNKISSASGNLQPTVRLKWLPLTATAIITGLSITLNYNVQAQVKPATNIVEVTGKIIDAKDKGPLPGVNVLLKGVLGKGTATDFDGKYKLKVPAGSTLIIKFLGYAPQEKLVDNNGGIINVQMTEEVLVGKEVIITGYQTAAKVDVAGSISQIKGDAIKGVAVSSFDAALQGRASGVQVTQSGGIAGSAVSIRIRGSGSFSAASEPLYVVDGIVITTGSNGDGGGAIGGNNVGYQTNALADISPADIESYDILKDAAATALYGARGANGVVLITTKRGKSGKTRFDVNYYEGVANPSNRVKMLDGPQYLNVIQQAYRNSWNGNPNNVSAANIQQRQANFPNQDAYVYPTFTSLSYNLAQQNNTDWLDKSIQNNARQRDFNMSGRGGTDRTQFFLGINYRGEDGVLKGNEFQRFGARFNLDNTATEHLKIGISSSITYQNNNLIPSGASTGNGGFGVAQTTALPIFPVFNPATVTSFSNPTPTPYVNQYAFNPYFFPYSGTNIVLAQNKDYAFNQQQVFRNISSLYLQYKISPQLTFKSEAGLDLRNQVDNSYQSRFLRLSSVGSRQPSATANDQRVFNLNYSLNNYLDYTKDLDDKNQVQALVGTSYQSTLSYNNGSPVEGFSNDNTYSVSGGNRTLSASGNNTQFSLLGYFAKLNYKLNNKYIFQASGRYEGSSRFGANARYGLFSGAGVGYILSEEDWMKKYTWVSLLKFSTSYGRTGNGAGLDNFQSQGLYQAGATYNLQPGTRPRRISNDNLTWELCDQFDMGLDFGFFKNRIEGRIGYYNRQSKNLLLGLPVAPNAGLEDPTQFVNVGKVANTGLEFNITTRNLVAKQPGGLEWTTDFNITVPTSTIKDLGGLLPTEVSGSLDFGNYVGGQISTFYLPKWAGVDPSTGEELIYRAERGADGKLTGNLTNEKFRPTTVGQLDSNRVPLFDKQINPKYYGGFINNIKYKGFDLSVMITYNIGNNILDAGQQRQSYVVGNSNLRQAALGASVDGDINSNYPKLYYFNAQRIYDANQDNLVQRGVNVNDPFTQRNTSRFVHDGSFVRLKNVSFGYTLPESLTKRMRLERLRLYVSATNLYVWTKFPGWDPEVVGNLQSNQQRNLQQGTTNLDFPQVKVITAGVNISF